MGFQNGNKNKKSDENRLTLNYSKIGEESVSSVKKVVGDKRKERSNKKDGEGK